MRQRLQRIAERDATQAKISPKVLQAANENNMAKLSKYCARYDEYAKANAAEEQPLPPDLMWTVLGPRCCDEEGRTALHYAACHGCYEAAMYLLTARMDPRMTDNTGFSALHFAAAHRQVLTDSEASSD